MRGALSLLFLGLLPVIFGKLLRVNEWYAFNLTETQTATLRLNFFYSCDGAAIVVKTARDLSTRLHLFFDGERLEKIDVDSSRVTSFPQTHKVIGGCREKERKSLVLNIVSVRDFFELHIDGQVFKRPKARKKANYIEIGLPQETSCCLIRATIKTSSEDVAVTEVGSKISLTTSPRRQLSTTPMPSPTSQPLITQKKETTIPTTSSHNKLYSWTEVVNREWSLSFLIFAGITCALMTCLIIFGVVSWGWLLTKPTNAKTLYRVDTPLSMY